MSKALQAQLMKIQIFDITDVQNQDWQKVTFYSLTFALTTTFIMYNLVELL